jgi:hypothetical protein
VTAAGLTQLADLIQGGKLHTRVGEVLPLSDANLTEPCPGIVRHRQANPRYLDGNRQAFYSARCESVA